MKLPNPLHFTENHRFTVYRDFSLGPIDYKMLTGVYQPMIGAVAAGLYSLLLQQLSAERAGYSKLDLQRKLFHGLDLEPNETGRKRLAEACSRLEAVGLLHTARIENASEEYLYEYSLFAPLKPMAFFQTQHLLLLLRDKIGAHALQSLQNELIVDKPEELVDPYSIRKELTSPFYEVFSLSAAAASDPVKEWSEHEAASATITSEPPLPAVRFSLEMILGRIPKSSLNRRHLERLSERHDTIARMNYYADKYGLTLKELGQLLDEDGMFDIRGEWVEEELERRAESIFMQRHKHEDSLNWSVIGQIESTARAESAVATQSVQAPTFHGEGFAVPESLKVKYDQAAYNHMLQTEPYTKVLQLFVSTNVMGSTKELFSKLNLLYRIPDEVLNALIHHMRVNELPWKAAYIEKVVASLQGQQITTYAQAVAYFNKEIAARSGRSSTTKQSSPRKAAGGRPTSSSSHKPKLPVYQAPSGKLDAAEKEEFARIVKYLEGKN